MLCEGSILYSISNASTSLYLPMIQGSVDATPLSLASIYNLFYDFPLASYNLS